MYLRKPPECLKSLSTLLFLMAASGVCANAQYCYVFSSSAAGISVSASVTITGQTIIADPTGQTRLIQFNYDGSYTETVGNVTLEGSGPVQNATIGFEGVPGTVPWTNLIMGPSSNPGSTSVMAGMYWSVSLNGTGDLLPTGLTPTLPPISAWQYNPGGGAAPPGNHIMIYSNGVSVKQNYDVIVDSITNCGGAASAKALGSPWFIVGCAICGDPISLGTGNLFEQVADYKTEGANQLGFTRYYNSMASSTTFATTLGPNWRSTYDRYLNIGSATSVTAERRDGQQLTFTLSNGVWTSDSDVDVKLTNSGSNWTLTDTDDTIETYTIVAGTSEAQLQTIVARNGYTQTLAYDGNNLLTTVTDSFNRQLSFAYAGGFLQTVTTPDGVVLTYGYTVNQLASISYPTSPVTSQTYVYENSALPNALTGIIDENGNRFSTWTYDAMGRALSSQHAGGAGLTQVAYNGDGSRTVTNPLGEQETYKFSTLQGVPKVTEVDRLAAAQLSAATRKFTYDTNGYTASLTDWNGNLTSYVNDIHGQPTSTVEAAGTLQSRTTTVTYHPTFHLPVQISTPGLTSGFTYDSNGEVLTKALTDMTSTTAPYSTNGQKRTWTYTWSNFQLASVVTPRTDVSGLTSFTYDESGALTGVTNGLGQTTQITQFLPGGLPQTIVDPNGVTTNLTYDPRLRLLASTISTAAGPLTTSYAYDATEEQVSVTLPDGSTLTNSYDAAHRVTGVTDLFGQAVAFTLDAEGDRTQTNLTDGSGNLQLTHSGVFDALGRLQQDVGAAGQITGFSYDPAGNVLTITDPLTHSTARTFDALSRLATNTDSAKGVGKTTYDSHNRPLTVTDPNGGVTSYVYDGFGDVIERVSPDSGTSIYRYDSDSNMLQRVDGAGAITNFKYDALDRVITASYPADPAENVIYTYDQGALGVGRLTGVSDAVGTLSRSYDERGNALNETRVNTGVTLVTTYTYDGASRVASITYPSGWMVSYTRDVMGRTTAVMAQAPLGGALVPVVEGIGYQPFGPVNSLTYGNGIAETRAYDLDYRVTNLADSGSGAVSNLTYAYDGANNVASIVDGVTASNSQSLGYDTLNRLTAAAGGYGSFGYSYDSVGNRLNENVTGSAATSYAYVAKSNQLAQLTSGGTTEAVGYDKAGNINSFNPAVGAAGITGLTYNQAGRLSTVMAGNTVAAQYTYDAFGRRLVRVGAVTATTLYQYDRSWHLLEETDGGGNPLADYIYLDSIPVATISPSTGEIYFLHDDRLGTPQVATDINQNIVWSASYGPFAEMSAAPGGIVEDLRLPGQEFDVETGLYHNGFRDYAPGWGRYLQPDPIGLAGGLNTYAYVASNPAGLTDPLGLMFDPQALSNTLSQLEGTISDDWQIATAQLQTLKVQGLSKYLKNYPCIVAAEAAFNADVTAAEQAVVNAYNKIKPAVPVVDVIKLLADATEDVLGALISFFPDILEYGSQQQDWGTKCGSCAPYGGTPAPANPAPQPSAPVSR